MNFTRRKFVSGLTLAGTAGLLGVRSADAAEPPPETTRLRIVRDPSICVAPQYVAEELLKTEGFTRVEYVALEGGVAAVLSGGKADLTMDAAPVLAAGLDEGAAIVVLAGVHVGCYELFGTERVRTIRDLRGKTVAISEFRDDRHLFIASIVGQVGLDPRKDVNWVFHPTAEAMRLLAEGKIDAFLGFPPEPQELRARKVGHVLLNTRTDRPWSQYFCCMVTANREFVRKHPVATKRAVRAILKADQICAVEPERAAQQIVDRGFTSRYDFALQTLKEVGYGHWRAYNPEDTLRFYALRLHEAGLIKSSPQKIIAQGADWRFLNELKKELKG